VCHACAAYLEEEVGFEERPVGVPVDLLQSIVGVGQEGGGELRSDSAQEREAVAQDVVHAMGYDHMERPHLRSI
jgi:hypothetical protein